jgi:cell wall-associated NlpC family hydrolase
LRVQVLLLLFLIAGCAATAASGASRAGPRTGKKAPGGNAASAAARRAGKAEPAAGPAGARAVAPRKHAGKKRGRRPSRRAAAAEPQFQPYEIANWPAAAVEQMPRAFPVLPPPPDLPDHCQLCETRLLASAYELIGTRYSRGGTRPETGFDCSGFVRYLYEQNFGLPLPPSAPLQFRVGFRVEKWELQPGDLVFFRTRRGWHVGMYVGNDAFIHAPNRRKTVQVSSLFGDPYWRRAFVGARRIVIPESVQPALADNLASNNN